MSDPLEVGAGELPVEVLLAAIDDGRRVVVHTEFAGSEHEVTLRRDGDTDYCETPTRLHRHDSAAEMRECLTEQGTAGTGELAVTPPFMRSAPV
jgi:hypothetical protein